MNISMKRTRVAVLLTLTMALFLTESTEAGLFRTRNKDGAQKMTFRERREARRNETPEEKNERRARFWGVLHKDCPILQSHPASTRGTLLRPRSLIRVHRG